MKKHKAKIWIIGYLIIVTGALSVVGCWVVKVDPFFHYHKPDTNGYYYYIDNQRSQNDGISKNFDYDALITGTSMTENFRTSEMDEIFGVNSIKVPYSGGTYKEINDNIANALENNPNLKTVVRGLDMSSFMTDKDAMRFDQGEFPTYLYDDVWYNDVKYIFNRNVIFGRVYPMVIANDAEGFTPGITSFDTYSNWMAGVTFGVKTVCPDGVAIPNSAEAVHLSEEEKNTVLGNVQQNITLLANAYPDVTFYCFFTPYSIVWWRDFVDNGSIYKRIEAEQLVIEEVLKCENIKLYSFNSLTEIITDLNNYKDKIHYGSWVNSLILRYMKNEKCLLTYDNYRNYLESEMSFYTSYDYAQLNNQVDYENDYYAEALLNYAINGVEPLDILNTNGETAEFSQAEIIENQYEGNPGLQCKGSLSRIAGCETAVSDYIATSDYVGAKFTIDDISIYKYLVFYGMKNQDHGQPSVYIYDQNNVVLAGFSMNYSALDDQWHQYIVDISQLSGCVTIAFNGGYIDNSGSANSLYTFSNMVLY